MLQESIQLLSDVQFIETEEDIAYINHLMCENFLINEYKHIDVAYELPCEEIGFISEHKYYIIWDNIELPIIKCLGTSILKCLDDIFALVFDMYIFSEDFLDMIYCDDLDVLWQYF